MSLGSTSSLHASIKKLNHFIYIFPCLFIRNRFLDSSIQNTIFDTGNGKNLSLWRKGPRN